MTAEPFRSQLAALEQRGRLRRLSPRAGRDFASNDYLGLAGDPMIAQAVADAVARGVPLGSGGSRLLRGNAPEHEGLEAKAADFFRTQAALFLANGYVANLALFSTLPQRGDLIVADELIHASVHDGIRMSKATAVFARHNDVQSISDLIAAFRAEGGKGRVWIAVETLYSMDGDMASLTDLAKLAARHEAMLLLDEAHGTGVFGPGGRGLSAGLDGLHNVVTLHTCGKAMGAEGALICGPRLMIDYLVNRARPFIYSTAPSPLMPVAPIVRRLDPVERGGQSARPARDAAPGCGGGDLRPARPAAPAQPDHPRHPERGRPHHGNGRRLAGGRLRRARHPATDRAGRHQPPARFAQPQCRAQ